MRISEFSNIQIKEGGNAITDSVSVPREYIAQVVSDAKALLPAALLKNLQADIGSAGFKETPAGDIDLMIEAQDLVDVFSTAAAKDPVKDAKKKLEAFLQQKGHVSKVAGRNVHVGIPFPGGLAQVDYMIIHDAAVVATWHQHGPRGSYRDPDFKGSDIFIVMNSIAKSLGLKFDAFGAKLMRRDNDEVVARDRDAVAKILFNPGATGDDLNSVKSMLAALKSDPRKDDKLAQARDDAAKNIVKLPGDSR
jgi:hypothetical protein